MPRVVPIVIALLVATLVGPVGSPNVAEASAVSPLAASPGTVQGAARPDPTGRWIVVYKDGADATAATRRAKARGVVPDRTYRAALHGYAAKLSASQLSAIREDPAVEFVAADGIVSATDQTVPRGVRRVDGPRSLVAGIDGVDQRVDADVAIFDTGIDGTHPDLNVVGGYNCSTTNHAAWGDDNGHGTHVAGTVGAIDNGGGVVGVAPGVRLWAVRILGADGNGLVSWYVCGMDWIAAQRDPVDPTRPLIEAVNMSVAKPGSDDHNCGNTNNDAIHKAVCRLVAAGVTVVAAAGNNGFNASRLIPASYDEVITVSALADTDGRPGGLGGNACFSWGTYDQDDTFADFSNYGADVDLIAPGKCIWSTLPDNRYGYSSGTSMAAPHVTGAAALWLSSRPGATPAQVKAALQAAATFDWKTSTDPDGVPDRLLDVAHLVALGDFTIDAGRVSGWIGASGSTVSVPVQLFRAEDFAADVTLEAVPTAPVTASLADMTLPGGGAVATSVTIAVPASTPSGSYPVLVSATDGARTRSVRITVSVDSDRPATATPTVTLAPSVFNTTSFTARARWAAATDATTPITAYQVSWRVDGGTWSSAVSLAGSARSTDRLFRVGHTYQLRLRSRDSAGNWSAWVTPAAYSASVTQDTSSTVRPAGRWRRAWSTAYSGGTALHSETAGATISKTFRGRGITWIAAYGPTRGSARVSIDGRYAGIFSLNRSTASYRRVVFSRAWAASGTHTITIHVVGTAGHPRVDLDAFVVIR